MCYTHSRGREAQCEAIIESMAGAGARAGESIRREVRACKCVHEKSVELAGGAP